MAYSPQAVIQVTQVVIQVIQVGIPVTQVVIPSINFCDANKFFEDDISRNVAEEVK